MDQSYFLFGKILYANNKDSLTQNIIHIRHLNKDSLVINNSLYQFQTYLRIPDSLKCSKKIDLSNKLLEFKVKYNNQLFTDTIYSTEKHQYIKNNNYNRNEKYSEKWIRDEYQIKDIDGFKIIFYNMNTYAIVKKHKEKLFFYQLTKNSIIKLSDKLRIEINNKIKKDKVTDSIYDHRHPYIE